MRRATGISLAILAGMGVLRARSAGTKLGGQSGYNGARITDGSATGTGAPNHSFTF